MGTVLHGLAIASAAALVACGAGVAEGVSANPNEGPGNTNGRGPATAGELDAFVAAGGRILAVSHGDIDADGHADVVLAVDQSVAEADRARSLLLLLRESDGRLRLAASNERIVPCAECGGIMGEPSIYLDSGKGFFALTTEGGSGWLWSNKYSFRHDSDERWLLESFSSTTSSRASHETSQAELTAREFGTVDFVDFDPDAMDDPSRHKE